MHHWTSAKEVAWVGDEALVGPIRAVRLSFHGLGMNGTYTPGDDDRRYGASGILTVFPYYGPWSWMNREARAMVDEVVDAVYAEYALPDATPLLLTGGSMGGGSALLYARYARHTPAGVYANCPVCDYTYHFTERPDLPRTFYHAYGHYAGDWQAILQEHSPLHQAAAMPDVPYFILHGDADTSVNKAAHSDRLVPALRARGLQVTYREVPGMGHGGPIPEDVMTEVDGFILGFAK